MLAILRQRNFALLWFGGLISMTGDWLLRIGLPVYVYSLTGSAFATSIMLITGFLPDVLLGSVAGGFSFSRGLCSGTRFWQPLPRYFAFPLHPLPRSKTRLL